ncbi:MAG: ATP-dependent DNA ligase [Chloroflexi bacterium]|nr:ATP-dependent DNA ligase [Chloroflexota bacterium]
MAETKFRELAQLGERMERTKKRLEIAGMVAEFLRGLAEEEIGPGVRLLIGQVFPEWDSRTLNLSWRAVQSVLSELADLGRAERGKISAEVVDTGEWARLALERFPKAKPQPPPLTLLEVYRTFEEIAGTSGPGSRGEKERLLKSLLQRATPVEAKYIVKDVIGEMRHGAQEGMILLAIARATKVEQSLVTRANMLSGDLGEVAKVALVQGEAGLARINPRLFRPLKPMLAQVAEGVEEALREHQGETALEYKLDGARVQIHKEGEEVRIYSRHLSDVTVSLPEVVAQVKTGLVADKAIVEGEVIAVDAAGWPRPFQEVMRRFRRIHDLEAIQKAVPVRLYLFDALLRNGQSLVDLPYEDRWQVLRDISGDLSLVERIIPGDEKEGEVFLHKAQEAGHEGVMTKSLKSPYTPGVRGKAWFKIKPAVSLDLVIIAADWGYGRRHGWLSNYHLATRDEETGEFMEVGKTFKGLTDKEFEEMTQRLLDLEISRDGGTVYVQPKTVVEVLFNEIQKSPHYPSGLALRFARITRLRDDKSAQEADTIQTMRQLFAAQFEKKGG